MSIKKCRNKCIFCFIDQLPKGLRKTLYLKDDDYLESFKYGNFITLTNLNERDIEKITKYNLSPLYISFHSADLKTRDIIFNKKGHFRAVDFLKVLDKHNIVTNIQIVVCPGINDGIDLKNTLFFLNRLSNVHSIGLVPVGITRYNKNKRLRPFDKIISNDLISLVDDIKFNEKIKNIYLSDEFYIIAGKDIPGINYYDDFPQIENRIGLLADFKNDFINILDKSVIKNADTAVTTVKKTGKKTNILVLTSEYSKNFIKSLAGELINRVGKLNLNFNMNVMAVKNEIFGGNVKVTGLLSFDDFTRHITSIKDINNYDKIFISDIIFNKEGITLDDKNKKDFRKISGKISFVKNNGRSFARELLKI